MTDRSLGVAVLLAAAAVAAVVPTPVAAATLILPLVSLLVGPKLALDRLAQAAVTVGAMLFGILVTRLLAAGPTEDTFTTLSERTQLLALPMVAVAAARALMVAPRFGAPVTLAAALVALTAAGRARPGLAYPLLAGAFLLSAFVALARAEPERAWPRRGGSRHFAVAAVAFAGAAALAALATATLPALQDAAMARLLQRFRAGRTGFADRVALGALSGLLQDDRVVMRLRGLEPPSLLRGAVLSEYDRGIWEAPRRLPVAEVVEVSAKPPSGAGLEIENARHPERYFLPLDARDVATSTGFFSRNALDIHRPIRGFEAKRVWFRTGGFRPLWAPQPSDLAVPRALAEQLTPLVTTWGAGTGPARARLDRIEAELQRSYRYSLVFERRRGHDPVADFLLRERTGHCEYFAGSLAILGRIAGVPTRVVTGYRVAERSPWGYAVVRQRHAHAWVEAWLDGRWVTFDPTPAAALAADNPRETPALAALFDRLATGWETVDDWLARRTPFELSLALVLGVGTWLLYRNLRARGRRETESEVAVEAPLPGYASLDRSLARHGLGRSAAETLAAHAARVAGAESLPTEERAALVSLLSEYAQLRYAGRGDAAALDAALSERARAL